MQLDFQQTIFSSKFIFKIIFFHGKNVYVSFEINWSTFFIEKTSLKACQGRICAGWRVPDYTTTRRVFAIGLCLPPGSGGEPVPSAQLKMACNLANVIAPTQARLIATVDPVRECDAAAGKVRGLHNAAELKEVGALTA